MDARNNMLIAKGKIVTSDVIECSLNSETQRWDITFSNGKEYHYSINAVVWLRNPKSLDPKAYQIHFRGRPLNGIESIFVFTHEPDEFWHICFSDGCERSYGRKELDIQHSCLENANARQVFDYLGKIAGQVSVRTEDDTAILQKQYEKIDFLSDDRAVAVYLNPAEYKASSGLQVDAPIFPFGCNKSQYEAVRNALSNRVSVIEGPPGTGKTQTILNIIANLVLNGKTVQVVSNNNSAIENIIEKLESPKYQLDFIVASLGRSEKKQAFIQKQSGCLPDLHTFLDAQYDSPEFLEKIKQASLTLGGIYDAMNRRAALRKEEKDVQLEKAHYTASNAAAPYMLPIKDLPAAQIMQLMIEYQEANQRKPGLIQRFLFRRRYGLRLKQLLRNEQNAVISELQHRYYEVRQREIADEIKAIDETLRRNDADQLSAEFTKDSLACFRSKLAQRYSSKERRKFYENDLWKNPDGFLTEYPVVLSTTYTARSSLGKQACFDYVIMDEASQVDVATGALALSCARNAVIVGDTKQLSNIVTSEQEKPLQLLFKLARIPKAYDFTEYSFLASVAALLGNRIPRTILREHYRCDPQIIGFCNQQFYHNELVVMTEGRENAIRMMTTCAGKHARERTNLRQAEVIRDEVLPSLQCPKNEIGIVTPYRNQVRSLRKLIQDPEIEIDTIHKYQGREKDAIIFSTVDDLVTDFSDNPELLNVAVSRAKRQFILVASEEEQPQGSNVGDLIGYIRYNHCEISHSAIGSVFDYMYRQYEAERLAFLKRHKRVSEYDSENLMHGLIEEVLSDAYQTLGVVSNYPLYQLIRDRSRLNDEENRYVQTGLSHVDFLIFSQVSKKPILAIEVDGYWFHKEGSRQVERDAMKNHILETYQLPLLRFATNGSRERETLSEKLKEIMPGL